MICQQRTTNINNIVQCSLSLQFPVSRWTKQFRRNKIRETKFYPTPSNRITTKEKFTHFYLWPNNIIQKEKKSKRNITLFVVGIMIWSSHSIFHAYPVSRTLLTIKTKILIQQKCTQFNGDKEYFKDSRLEWFPWQ